MKCEDCVYYSTCRCRNVTYKDRMWEDKINCDLFEDKNLWVRLPCKVGDKVYFVVGGLSSKFAILCRDVTAIKIQTQEIILVLDYDFSKGLSSIGETMFLTKEEAEAKIKELRGEGK